MPNTDTDTELEEFRDELAWMLTKLGPMMRQRAEQILRQDPTFNPSSAVARMNLLHETPYYWAMSHLYGGQSPPWFKQPGNWPPPAHLWQEYERDRQTGAWQPLSQP